MRSYVDGLRITVVENTVDLADLDEIATQLQSTFWLIQVRRTWSGPMASGLFPETAIVIAIAIAAQSFLSELGKDAYRAIREAIFRLFRKAPAWANGRYYVPMRIEVTFEVGEPMLFWLPAEMDATTFDHALSSIAEAISSTQRDRADHPLSMRFDSDKNRWEPDESFYGG